MRILLLGLTLMVSVASFAKDFDYEDLVSLIDTNHLTRVEDVLPLLPRELRSRYTLMRVSRSLQKASDEYPRAIMFGNNAKLTCSFNGAPDQRGYDSIECFQFRDENATFDFRQIQFPTPENGLDHVEFSESNRTVDKKIACSGCHGADPRPNWDSYSRWPGAYGEEDDVLREEEAGFKTFYAIRDGHDRYKWLIQDDYKQAPYMAGDHFDIDHRPNLYFSEAIGRLMGLRNHRLMQDKLGERQSLGFAVGVLQCLFTDDQKKTLKDAGINLEKEIDVAAIFARMDMSARQWSTIIFNDRPNLPQAPWDHQFGYTYLKENIAMKTVQDYARTDGTLAVAIAEIKTYFDGAYKDPDLRFFQTMNETILGLDYFGKQYIENRNKICPRMAEIFTEKFSQR